MANTEDDLEALFDYTRVQPNNIISLDDDSLEELPEFLKKRKRCNSKVESTAEDDKGVEVIDCDDDEDDWLLPPPKVSEPTVAEENSTIKELRLKKQELAAIAQSAEELLAVDETVKKDLSKSLESAQDSAPVQQPKPSSERTKIVISIQDKDEVKQFRIYKDDKFERLFKLYTEKLKLDLEKLVFIFDGDKINPSATPEGLGLEEEEMIEVRSK